MNITRHGLSIGIDRVGDEFFLSLTAVGKLTHADYETITPIIDSAPGSVQEPKVKVLVDGTEMEGCEPRAAWDDFKRLVLVFGRNKSTSHAIGSDGPGWVVAVT